ncbi:MAG: hypothetical protein AAGC81_19805 [Pseudomonadota bacterium]
MMGSLLSSVALLLAAAPAGDDCDAHAIHIDQVLGADTALKAYDILHDHTADPAHLIDDLKAEHPDVEHELEDYVAAGCTRALLVAHAHD